MSRIDGLLIVAHGTVRTVDELPQFLEKIRRGRPPPAGLVEELEHRYQAIGGSPLLGTTSQQARGISERLGLPAWVAMRLWHPFVEEVLPELIDAGIRRVLTLPLAPYSVSLYCAAAREAAQKWAEAQGIEVPEICASESWATHPAYVQAHARNIEASLGTAPDSTVLVLSAHSLPERVVRAGDRYQIEVEACAAAIGKELGWDYRVAYQSAGADGGPWLGPDLPTTLDAVRDSGARRVVIAPIGFVADHVETLYDLDIEAKAMAAQRGLEWARVPALNEEPVFLDALAQIARENIERLNGS